MAIEQSIPLFPGTILEQAIDAQVNATVQRSELKFVLIAVVLAISPVCQAALPAAVSGIVRDAQGVAQMGALVQIVSADSMMARTTSTDIHGRYLITNLIPGKYQVRATAALFVPAMREQLLRAGGRSVVNLTLSTLSDTATWLPAERRKTDEPGDDWKWTLRSAANRPILRMVDDDGQLVLISSSATERKSASQSAKGAVTTGDGDFGGGGVHTVMSLNRVLDDGSDVVLRIDMGSMAAPGRTIRPSTEFQTGYERRVGLGGVARTMVSYQSHPEMVETGGRSGLDAMRVASVQKIELGDMVEVEAGSALDVVHTSGYAVAARPFLRVSTHPASEWTLSYRMATARDLQSFDAMDSMQPELPVAVLSKGRMQMERGTHQEVSVTRKAGKALLQASYYHDALANVMVSGTGDLATADLMNADGSVPVGDGAIADPVTDSFRMLAGGYRTQGINVTVTQPLSTGMWAAAEYNNGAALASKGEEATTLAAVSSGLKLRQGQSATIALRGRVLRSGTSVRAAYRWQPSYLVTAVNPYAAYSDQAYLSFYVRQPLTCGHWLPPGLDATVDVTNLLAQGYRPFLSADGRTLYLAQAPRTIQAGLSFNF